MMLIIDVAAGLVVLAGVTYGLVALCQLGLNSHADRRGKPVPDPDRDLHWTGAVTGGQPLSRAALRDTRRDLALSGRRRQARATVSSIARHYRRHGGA